MRWLRHLNVLVHIFHAYNC